MLKIAVVQSNIIPDNKEQNLQHYKQLLSENISENIDILVLPEMFNCGFSSNVFQNAEQNNGISYSFLCDISLEYNCDVVGTLPIFEENKLYNRLLWFSSGKVISQYDKHHLFIGEEKFFSSGKEKNIVESKGYKFLPLICFDVRFPEWCRNTINNNAFAYDCLIFSTNFPSPRENELKILASARAIENQCYVIVANRIGNDGFGKSYSGGTFIVNPHGEIETEFALHEEGVLIHSCNLNYLKILRNNFPVSKFWS